ncbi:histidine kinase [Actinoplanes sp. SE50]|uniref:sensor histidine kinase n=1 Tax=unclassified Actinoplanes TaxID=2626549 RepID=UPI00023ECA3E|nr:MULTISPECIES: histidine kinase [unclassified Actinoplanes]AEV87688.1 histidine kinase [Actinoplanes sp. SE50/110]ATO86091.1 histidine kinase [Actinoplanes sp. SE50]SLM03505.1 two-component sensor histidine kinase [Actinoplanes sp. SE50/110]
MALDARDTLTRMLLLDCSGLAYLLVIGRTGHPPTPLQWALAVPAFLSALLLHRHPPINLLLQTALFAAGMLLLDDSTINQVGTAWAIGEFALWAGNRWLLAGGIGMVAATYLICDPPDAVLPSVMGLATSLGLPTLIGLVVRTTRELGVQAEQRAVSEQRAARADERGAIARELHDVVAHHVASMVLRVGVAQHVLPGVDPKVAEVFDDVHRTGTAALGDLRRLVAVLRDPDRAQGDAALTAIEPSALPAALDGAVETARRAGVIVEAEIDPRVAGLDAVRGLALLRLTQEALTNVAKHAGPAARAVLRVTMGGDDLHWSVTDDGGAAPGAARVPGGGHGLTGMRERVEILGGALAAGPEGSGWRVSTVLPAPLPDGIPA